MSRFGFLSQLKLLDQQCIRTVCRKGKKISASGLNLFYYPNKEPHPRICISISKKQVGKAWQRHRIKRIMRESFRLKQHELPALDIVIIVFKPLALIDKGQLRQLIDAQWKKLISLLKMA